MRHAHSVTLSMTRLAAATLAALAMLSACGAKDAAAPAGGPGANLPPPEVGVIVTKFEPVALQTELPARVEPVRVAQVRARVTGVVLKRMFQEGSEVKAGQTLFQIDPAPYQAALSSARANLGKSEANLNQAAALAARYKPLVEANAISKQEYVNVVAAQQQAEADVAAQKAAVQIARINSGYASVQAPIAGRIGRALVTEGALVSATEATQLALIQQTNTVYLNITQSATELLRLRRDAAAAAGAGAGSSSNARAAGAVPVTVLMDDGTELPHKGKLLFSDVTVDPTSGQVTLRAEVPNQDGLLLPGQYVRVRLSQASLPAAIVVPQQAVTRSTQGDTVIVVADGKPAPRPIKIGSQQGTNWIVQGGLKPGEQVVVDGFQKMMVPGAPVKPVPWTAPAGNAAPATASVSR
ncbi:efflux RND transporter periplasmic adaptor subunit [Massilia psychrophila]|uniref:Efflux transporter periplasmic adaptor subunit n=1 Tax=Massilia psychrophila TaxID=1603353 RepID=A0A2G8SZA0_9BURK|nr:efflux RND transporter periplasmic adaptor subunit [Massilia psychrophila]PIL39125.1 efflux transporter periplasmic adaptor subunit [Massilia psychrophila]GGE85091.1 MexX family efflux pump subunit [Massilia psychrophila]